MITAFLIRDNIDNGHIFGEPTSFFAGPFDRRAAGYDTIEDAAKHMKIVLKGCPSKRDKLYITETEYADEKRQREDFCIQSCIRWAGWFHDDDYLERLIEGEEE